MGVNYVNILFYFFKSTMKMKTQQKVILPYKDEFHKVKSHHLNLSDSPQSILMKEIFSSLFYLEVKDRILFLISLLYFIWSLSLKSLERANRIAVTFGINPI